jgi:hypothetical protein
MGRVIQKGDIPVLFFSLNSMGTSIKGHISCLSCKLNDIVWNKFDKINQYKSRAGTVLMNILTKCLILEWDSSVSIIVYVLGNWGSIPGRGRDISLYHCVKIVCGVLPSLLFNGCHGIFCWW